MKKLEFSKEINASAEKVWETLWNEDTYSKWTAPFNPNGGSTIQSDWEIGGKTLFVDINQNGMVSTIKSISVPIEIVFVHLGEIKNGIEDITSEKVKSFAGSQECYYLSETGGVTTLKATAETNEEWVKMITNGFEEGLEIVKKISEES